MKTKVTISGFLLFFLMIAIPSDLLAQGRRGMPGFDAGMMKQRRDSTQMMMPGRHMAMMQRDSLNRGMRDFSRMHYPAHAMGMRFERMNPGMTMHGMRNRQMGGAGRPGNMMGQPFYGGRNFMPGFGNGRGAMMQNTPGRRIMESIPGITEKQQKELVTLNETHKSEMQKLREKHVEEMKALREDHRKKVSDLLTKDQKKWLEENAPEK